MPLTRRNAARNARLALLSMCDTAQKKSPPTVIGELQEKDTKKRASKDYHGEDGDVK